MKRKALLSIASLLFAITLWGQDTITIYINNKEMTQVTEYAPDNKNKVTVTTYYKSGELCSQYRYSNYSERKFDGAQKEWYEGGQLRQYEEYENGRSNGKHKRWYENGQLRQEIDYKDGKFDGQILTYWENGTAKRIDEYKNGELITGKCFNVNGEEIAHFNYIVHAIFPGGPEKLFQYLSNEPKYPRNSYRNKIEGKVIVEFAINTDGSISDVVVTKSVSEDIDKEAIRVMKKMPKWIPSKIDGELITVFYTLPLQFRLTK